LALFGAVFVFCGEGCDGGGGDEVGVLGLVEVGPVEVCGGGDGGVAGGVVAGAEGGGGEEGVGVGEGLEGDVCGWAGGFGDFVCEGAGLMLVFGGKGGGESGEGEGGESLPGCCCRASFLYAVLISAAVADLATPRTSYGLMSVVGGEASMLTDVGISRTRIGAGSSRSMMARSSASVSVMGE